MIQLQNIQASIKDLKAQVSEAVSFFDHWSISGDEYSEPSWSFELCFVQLLAIVEALHLEELRKMVFHDLEKIKKSKDGFTASELTPEQEPFSLVGGTLRRYVSTLESFFPEEDTTKITKDLLDIIRDVHYVITDKALFGAAPRNETDVHVRIEGILKCLFSDLKHKPVLTKAIKNFQPDTGIPSLNTLIEYKFLSEKTEIGRIADEVLADTRGYTSKDWNRFLYVIYETNRFRTQKEWNHLLKQSGIQENTTIIVLSGEPIKRKKKATGTA